MLFCNAIQRDRSAALHLSLLKGFCCDCQVLVQIFRTFGCFKRWVVGVTRHSIHLNVFLMFSNWRGVEGGGGQCGFDRGVGDWGVQPGLDRHVPQLIVLVSHYEHLISSYNDCE